MSPIRVPRKRAYYPASPNEQDRLLLWIPEDELEGMVEEGLLPQAVLEDFPRGLEVEVTPESINELGLDLGTNPEAVRAVYAHLSDRGQVPDSGMVDAAALEQATREIVESDEEAPPPMFTPEFLERASRLGERELPEPEMTDGEEPTTFLRRIR
jgi:hypothetical protein